MATAVREPSSTVAPEGLPPGPHVPGIFQAVGLVARPLGFVRKCRERYGPTFTVHFVPFGKVVYLTEPDDVKAAFTGDADTFHTGEARESLAPILGHHSLLLLDEDEHLRERRPRCAWSSASCCAGSSSPRRARSPSAAACTTVTFAPARGGQVLARDSSSATHSM